MHYVIVDTTPSVCGHRPCGKAPVVPTWHGVFRELHPAARRFSDGRYVTRSSECDLGEVRRSGEEALPVELSYWGGRWPGSWLRLR
jgi:hypothetical protein